MSRAALICLLTFSLSAITGCSLGVWQDDVSDRIAHPGDDAARVARSRAHVNRISIDELRALLDATNAQRLDLLAQARVYRKHAASALSNATYSDTDRVAYSKQYAAFASHLEQEAATCAQHAAAYTSRMALIENRRQRRLKNAQRYDHVRVALPQ